MVDSERPVLSGLVLSRVDERGNPRDGYVRLHDIYNLHLAADLVVLSACQSALGKEFRKYLQHINLSKEDPAIKERAHPAGSGSPGDVTARTLNRVVHGRCKDRRLDAGSAMAGG